MRSHKRLFTLFLTPQKFLLILPQRRWLKDTGRVNTEWDGPAHTAISSPLALQQEPQRR